MSFFVFVLMLVTIICFVIDKVILQNHFIRPRGKQGVLKWYAVYLVSSLGWKLGLIILFLLWIKSLMF